MSNAIINTTSHVGKQFMEIMDDYMARQDDPDFDVAVEIDDLYTSLSNLYYNNTTTPQQ